MIQNVTEILDWVLRKYMSERMIGNLIKLSRNAFEGVRMQSFSERRSIERHSERALNTSERERRSNS